MTRFTAREMIIGAMGIVAGCQGEAQTTPPAVEVEQVISQPAEQKPEIELQRIGFEDQIVLKNARVHVAVSPQAGRIVGFGPADGRNLLWINTIEGNKPITRGERTYFNVGGDKLWPLVQALWPRALGGIGWPPDGVLDGQPWELIDQGERHVVMQSRLSPHLGVRFHREIRLSPSQGRVVIHNRMTQEKPTQFPLTIWSVTQVNAPQYTLLGISPNRPVAEPWVQLSATLESDRVSLAEDESWVRFDYVVSHGRKIGTLGDWVASVWDDYAFIQTTRYIADAAYPDASSSQVFYDQNYLELELLSPTRHLQPGQTLSNVVNWWLIPRDEKDAAAIAAQAKSLAEQANTAAVGEAESQ